MFIFRSLFKTPEPTPQFPDCLSFIQKLIQISQQFHPRSPLLFYPRLTLQLHIATTTDTSKLQQSSSKLRQSSSKQHQSSNKTLHSTNSSSSNTLHSSNIRVKIAQQISFLKKNAQQKDYKSSMSFCNALQNSIQEGLMGNFLAQWVHALTIDYPAHLPLRNEIRVMGRFILAVGCALFKQFLKQETDHDLFMGYILHFMSEHKLFRKVYHHYLRQNRMIERENLQGVQDMKTMRHSHKMSESIQDVQRMRHRYRPSVKVESIVQPYIIGEEPFKQTSPTTNIESLLMAKVEEELQGQLSTKLKIDGAYSEVFGKTIIMLEQLRVQHQVPAKLAILCQLPTAIQAQVSAYQMRQLKCIRPWTDEPITDLLLAYLFALHLPHIVTILHYIDTIMFLNHQDASEDIEKDRMVENIEKDGMDIDKDAYMMPDRDKFIQYCKIYTKNLFNYDRCYSTVGVIINATQMMRIRINQLSLSV